MCAICVGAVYIYIYLDLYVGVCTLAPVVGGASRPPFIIKRSSRLPNLSWVSLTAWKIYRAVKDKLQITKGIHRVFLDLMQQEGELFIIFLRRLTLKVPVWNDSEGVCVCVCVCVFMCVCVYVCVCVMCL
jgi:hypothetical protein